jgi:hypothetical protein
MAVSVLPCASPLEIVSRSSADNLNGDCGMRRRGRTPPDWANQEWPVVRDTPAAAAACRSVAPLARAVKNVARTSAGFGFLPKSTSKTIWRSASSLTLALIG